ncbi:hypothetical protein F5883DRAFT_545859 [Diaporthe sp. PMI_573]|nr:hypothetical protein F5883DRAFT_545859 [Diaporthaceae sp. PMI_573]
MHKWLGACCRLLVLCLAASLPTKDKPGSGSTWDEKKDDHSISVSGRRFTHERRTHRALPARQRTLRDGRTDKIMAAGKGGFCRSY